MKLYYSLVFFKRFFLHGHDISRWSYLGDYFELRGPETGSIVSAMNLYNLKNLDQNGLLGKKLDKKENLSTIF